MSALTFVRDGRTLPFVPVTADATGAIRQACEGQPRRLAYARSLYLALLELANQDRTDRVAVSRRALGEMGGCSRELVSELRPLLEGAGVVLVQERSHGGQVLEHEWVLVEPPGAPSGLNDTHPTSGGHNGRVAEAQQPLEGEKGRTKGASAQAHARKAAQQVPDDFPNELRPHAREVMRVLRSVAEQHSAREVTALAVARVCMGYPRHPLVQTAHDFASWAADPPRPIKDVVGSYRTWIKRERPLAATERLNGEAPAQPPAAVVPLRRGASAEERRLERQRRRFATAAAGQEAQPALGPGA